MHNFLFTLFRPLLSSTLRTHVEVFWFVTSCSVVPECHKTTRRHKPENRDLTLHPEDGVSTDLWNVGILPQFYTRRRHESSLPWKPQFRIFLGQPNKGG